MWKNFNSVTLFWSSWRPQPVGVEALETQASNSDRCPFSAPEWLTFICRSQPRLYCTFWGPGCCCCFHRREEQASNPAASRVPTHSNNQLRVMSEVSTRSHWDDAHFFFFFLFFRSTHKTPGSRATAAVAPLALQPLLFRRQVTTRRPARQQTVCCCDNSQWKPKGREINAERLERVMQPRQMCWFGNNGNHFMKNLMTVNQCTTGHWRIMWE